MATFTTNLSLSKAETTDAVRSTLTANNGNFDTLDSTYQSMKEQINRLKANQIQGTASGTEIVVEDSAEMESILHISGNSEQDSRSGKNLLNLSDRSGGLGGGATLTVANGIITLNGTTTSTGENVFDGFQVSEDGDYTFSIELSTTTSGSWAVLQESTDKSSWSALFDFNFSTLTRAETKTLNKSKYYRLRMVANGGVTYANLTVKLQLEKGTTATEWEPYGVQPSPDYPSEIRSVKSKSDNLFSSEMELGSILGTGELQTNANCIRTKDFIPVEPNLTYAMANSKSYTMNLYYYDENKGFLSSSSTTTGIFTVPANAYYFKTRTNTVTTENDLTVQYMLNKGDKALPYQPYGYVPVEAKVEGKNLLYFDDKEGTTSAGAVSYSIKDQSITINGTTSGSGWTINLIGDSNSTTPIIKFEANQTYYMKMFVEGGSVSSNGSDVQLRNSSGNIVAKTMGQLTTGFTYTPTENIDITWSRLYLGNSYTFTNLKFKLQVSRVNLNEWVEPAPLKTLSLPLGDIELRSTPDGTRDTFERVDGVWNKVSNIGSAMLDGSDDEFWSTTNYNTNDGGKIYYYLNDNIKITPISSTKYEYSRCSHFYNIYSNWGSSTNNKIGFYSDHGTTSRKYFGVEQQTLAEFQTWLASNPIQLDYILATPTYTPMTDETLIKALDELESLILHKGYNRITVTSVNGVKAYLDLSYVKDINIVLDNIKAKLGGE